MRPTPELLFEMRNSCAPEPLPSQVGVGPRRSSRVRPRSTGREWVLHDLRRALWVGLLVSCGWVGLVGAASSAPEPRDAPAQYALRGPWRWLEPAFDDLRAVDALEVGPWREIAITRDHERRQLEVNRLEAELVARDGSLSGFWNVRPPARAPILRRAAIDSARLLEAAGESAAAASAYASVVDGGEVVVVDVWHGLAVNLARTGDATAAERAFLRGLDASGRASDQIRFRYDLARFYAREGRLIEALSVVHALMPHAPESSALAKASAGLQLSLEVSALARPRGTFRMWPTKAAEPVWDEFGPRLAAAARQLPESLQVQLLPWAHRFAEEERVRTAVFAVVGLLVVLAIVAVLRQRGDVAVTIEYPEELRGVFRVRLRSGRRALPEPLNEEEIRKGGASGRKEHHMVSRETQFQRLFTGRYHIIMDGLLVDPESDEILGKIREDKIVRVRHRRTMRIEFDVYPSTCPVDIRVVWGDRSAQEAQVTVPGFIDKPRAAVGGAIRVLLPKGDYRLLVGCGDRVFDQGLAVASFRPASHAIDVLEAKAVFKGCPPAVHPYLIGDLSAVARALERDGQAELGFRLLATKHQEEGEVGRAADFYESAGDPRAAARLRFEQGDLGRAAALFEQAEEWLEAAKAYRRDGQILNAGSCYERALDYERAIECYRESGAIDRWLTALERYGDVFQAAKLALEYDQRPRAIRLLQRVESTDDDFREACALLAEAFETEGHFDLAAGKLDEHISTFRPAFATADTYSRLAELWEQAGHLERSLDVLEDLRRREPTFPNVAARIELLRKQRSASGHLYSSGSRHDDGGATAFVGDVRYDLLEEIGRGGMGVVYRARDTRLDRIVALKRLPEGLRRHHPRALQSFLREAQSAARLNHPNIVTVFDADQQDGQFFITMELLEGQPLQTILHERGQLSPSNVLGIARQACRGLDYAHGQGVIHRDIKTANLFVTTERVVKIMDFGLAKVLEEVRGATTLVSGTPYYMSPEQVLGQDVDHRSDLYSLGVMLFELATGAVPFNSGEIGYHHRHTPVPDPQSLRPDLSDALSHLILHLLQKERDERVQSAADVLRALTEIDPITA
ncbi:MAG: protein kinase [bacterium]|nr:protein kinase [bacterium]